MRHRFVTCINLLALSSALTLISGCDTPTTRVAKQLVGKWQAEPDTGLIEFFDDGRLAMADHRMSVAGNWRVLQDGRVKIEVSLLGFTGIGTGRIDGEVLRLIFSGSRDTTIWRRQH